MNRRNFIQRATLGGLLIGTQSFPLTAFAENRLQRLTILHTNDWHSRIDPFPMDGDPNQGLGGVARRAVLIEKVRKETEQVLLLDSGDIFQGTPYFNYYHGEPELKLMSLLGYDAAAVGNHDFDGGMDGLYSVLPHANFPLLSANYDFSNTVLHDRISDYKIFDKAGIKVGVFGLGIELRGMVPKELYKETQYLDPVVIGNKTAAWLRHEEGCHLVICLSHLGYKYSSGKISDVLLAESSKEIDIILGGHTHTFLDEPDVRINMAGKEVIISQVGWGGILLGRLDVYFERNFKSKCVRCKNSLVEADPKKKSND